MAVYQIKVTGFEAIEADSADEALEKFDTFMRKDYKVSDLRWKSVEAEGSGHKPKHWYLVHYTASDPFNRVVMEAMQEVALDHLWKPGSMKTVVGMINNEMLRNGYKQYSQPILTSVYYMGVFDV